ncbi:MAG: hypothetical protein J6Y55_06755 [Bacteroidales bacterium]|nr:hypothetical protein [Bacteroidales bacterium]
MEITGKNICKGIRLYSKRLLWPILHWYDITFKKELTVAVADLMLLRDGEIYNRQFYVAARLLDAKLYYEHGDTSFPYQVAVSYNYRPKSYDREKRTKEFIELLESVKENGYDPSSPLIIDKELYLINGTHRMSLAIYNNIQETKTICWNRKKIIERGFERRPLQTLSPQILQDVISEFNSIQKQLFQNGQSFLIWISGTDDNSAYQIFHELKPHVQYHKFYKVTNNIKPIYFENLTIQNGYFAQFIPNRTDYKIQKGTYYSQYVKELHETINKSTNNTIYISPNCSFGYKLYTLCRPYAIETVSI